MGLHANFTYVPFYGKFSGFNKFIFQWDAYIIGGVGFMRTRPIPVFDPEIREFGYGIRAAFNIGIGIRIFLTRWMALFGEFRNYMFLEKFENEVVSVEDRSDPSTWLADGSTFFNNATIQIGLTFFFPSKFKYRKPK
jgi:outer membrane beta-barrel protein